MTETSFEQRSERRSRLIGLLRSEEHWTTSDLRDQLGVSQRTLMRELAELRNAGYPIESDRGRGGGIRLDGRWGIERLNLSHQEVVELILSLAIMESLQSPLLTGNLKAIRQKLFQAFPQKQRSTVSNTRKRTAEMAKAGRSNSRYISLTGRYSMTMSSRPLATISRLHTWQVISSHSMVDCLRSAAQKPPSADSVSSDRPGT